MKSIDAVGTTGGKATVEVDIQPESVHPKIIIAETPEKITALNFLQHVQAGHTHVAGPDYIECSCGATFWFTNRPAPTLVTPREFCICAAIVAEDGRIFRGHRHSDALMTAAGAGTKGSSRAESQGFITSTGRFVDRVEGAKLQEAAGIVSVQTKRFTDFLFSEDLY